ncbi:diaminobutyrate--2-oxoglutarate transaminase [Mitsuaria sp. GD03876]|uniref:diaminobutyrate--2-oxoglutarate transaminase n=1 Tax=Mitsuaria sp. GD03876 TaxID=2975399 RepID=UPI002447DDB9|nr:diaminobutyrate--2-oxoglutarate transaminase [Mitsuaria sp. GD03876]MDH0865609.1 diaminobutyrate--2-oxoglutarate transaminase [Mitsuaria sp. GD03876]
MNTSAHDTPHATVFDRHESVARSYCRRIPAVFSQAGGSWLHDSDGRRFLDFLAGCGALNYGHNDPDMSEALVAHIRRGGVATSMDLHTDAKRTFLEVFARHVLQGRGLPYRVQFTGPTGTNAIEAALKLARKVTGRHNVIAFTNGFHGVSLGALAATGNQYHRMGAPLPGITRLPYDGYLGASVDTADLLERMLGDPSSGLDAPAAILLEVVQGEGGLNVASAPWLRRVAALARRHGALLIVDDIQAGCGRTGDFFSFEAADVLPDLVTLSKSISGFGLPMSLLLIRPDHDQWRPAEHNGTFRGNNHAFVTATVAVEKFWADRRLGERVQAVSRELAAGLRAIAAGIPGATVKGRGLMVGIDARDPARADAIAREAYRLGLIIETAGPNDEVVKLLPPLTVSDEELALALRLIRQAVEASADTGADAGVPEAGLASAMSAAA